MGLRGEDGRLLGLVKVILVTYCFTSICRARQVTPHLKALKKLLKLPEDGGWLEKLLEKKFVL